MTKKSAVWFGVSLLVCAAIGVELAIAFTTASGFAATDFATGFVTFGGRVAPIGLAFDASGNLYAGTSQTVSSTSSALRVVSPPRPHN